MTEDDLSPRQRALAGEFVKEGLQMEDAIQMASVIPDAAQPQQEPGEEHPVLKHCDELHDLGFNAGWNGAIEESAKIAEYNGWERTAEQIRALAQPPAAPVETEANVFGALVEGAGGSPASDREDSSLAKGGGSNPPSEPHNGCSAGTSELKPCPFCGKPPVMIASTEDDSFVRCYEIRCDQCGIEVSEEYKGETIERWNTRAEPQPTQVLNFFSQNVDAWGAAEWFDRMAKAIREQDAAVVAGDKMTMEMCQNVAASSAMHLVRDYEQQVRAALSLPRPESK
jgi:Lar family restriction alleviation protein